MRKSHVVAPLPALLSQCLHATEQKVNPKNYCQLYTYALLINLSSCKKQQNQTTQIKYVH